VTEVYIRGCRVHPEFHANRRARLQTLLEALSKFADRNKISGWAAEAAAYTAKTGILNGRTTTTFVPQGTGTRAEAAVMMKRFIIPRVAHCSEGHSLRSRARR